MSREELLASNPEARAMYEKLQSLRSTVDSIKSQSEPQIDTTGRPTVSQKAASAQWTAADQAVVDQARYDAQEKQRKALAAAQKKAIERKKMEEAERRAALREYQAELMRAKAVQAAEQANMEAASQHKTAENIIAAQAEERAREIRASQLRAQQQAARKAQAAAENAQRARTTQAKQTEPRTFSDHELDQIKDVLQNDHDQQDYSFSRLSNATDRATGKLNEKQQAQVRELTDAQRQAKVEREQQKRQLRAELERSRAKRNAEESRRKADRKSQETALKQAAAAKKAAIRQAHAEEAARQKAEKQARAMKAAMAKKARAEKEAALKRARELEEERIKEARKEKARQLWRERDEKRQARRRAKLAEKQKQAAEKKQIHDEIKRYRHEKKVMDEETRLRKIREEDAARGGGLVTIHDMTIRTEINKRENIRLWDLLGLKTKAERHAATEEERMRLMLEREFRREDARAKFSFNRMLSIKTYQNSRLGKLLKRFGDYCDRHKRGIITASASVVTVLVIAGSAVSYCTAYQYSYNGTVLGVVNNKEDVLNVTTLVENALSEDNNMNVVIQPEDITFKRVNALGDVEIDNTEEVLKRLTYMGDFKVSSYGIYVDGKKIGAVRSKNAAASVLEKLKTRYTSKMENSQIESAVFLEKVKVKLCSTKLENVHTVRDMVSILTTDTKKETVHKAVSGETIKSIAAEYATSESKILKDNPNLRSGKVDAGTPVIIKATAPPVTVKITEKVTYTETIKCKVIKTKDKTMYKGDKKVTKKGANGSRDVTAEITTANGQKVAQKNLVTTVTKEPKVRKVTVGTKKRPPTVGDGKFKIPIWDDYHSTTGFEWRWGSFHKGVDIACPTGTKVHAADGGTVIVASYKPSYGNLVVIDHKNGYTTRYGHNSKILCKVGDKVAEGDVIALVGSTGNSTGPHCHFEIRYNDVPKNPRDYVTIH